MVAERKEMKMSTRTYILFTLIINGLAPWGIYEWLCHSMSSVLALSIATLVPLADNLVHLLRHKKLDVFGALMLFTFVLTLVPVSLGGSEKILLIRESLITGSVGLVFLGSLLFKRPLMYYLVLRFLVIKGFSDNWKYEYFRYPNRFIIWNDIHNGTLYGLNQSETVIAAVVVDEKQSSRYESLNWVDRQGNPACIHRLAVHPEFQGRGLGKTLLQFAEQQAFDQTCTSIRLDVFSANDTAVRMYERAGYERIGTIRFPFAKRPIIVLRRYCMQIKNNELTAGC
jgi:ribosomal protein S18 acetylase RimI-like enzyme